MNLNIPVPPEVQSDLRNMISNMAREVIQEVREKEVKSRDYMSAKDTCEYLNISFVTLQNFERLGLKKCRVQGKILFRKETVDEFMRSFEK